MSKDPITIIESKLSELEKQIRAETDEAKKEALQIKYLTLSDLMLELEEE